MDRRFTFLIILQKKDVLSFFVNEGLIKLKGIKIENAKFEDIAENKNT